MNFQGFDNMATSLAAAPIHVALQQMAAFRGISDIDASQLAAACKLVRLPMNTQLFDQGEPGTSMAIVADGMLRVEYTDPDTGQMTSIGNAQTGEFVGEMALLDTEPRSARVVSATDAVVYVITQERLAALEATAPGAACALVGAITRNLTRRVRKIDHLASQIYKQQAPPTAAETGDDKSVMSKLWANITRF